MAHWDKQYIALCENILANGVKVENRTGIPSIKIPSYHFHFDLANEFPVLTTKKLYIRQAILEMLWIYQVQSNDVRWLQKRDVHIWDLWEIGADGTWRAMQNIHKNGRVERKEVIKQFPKKYAHTIGTAYGFIVKKFNMTQALIDTIKHNPTDRRMVMSLWQDEYLETAVLPSCVWSSEWDVTDGRLNCWVHQRSCDVPLGLPFNVTQYAALLMMLAKTCGLKPGTMDWSIKDAHIYENQVAPIRTQIERFHTLEDLPAPTLWLNPRVTDFFEYDNSRDIRDIKLEDYQHHGPLEFHIAQ